MKRSSFQPPTKEKIAELNQKKRSRIINSKDKKTQKATKTSYKDKNAAKEAKQGKQKASEKGYKAPKWFTSIKVGAHGKTPAQKKLWRVVSETYREYDYNTYGPNCPCCGIHLERWQDGQLGHWLRYSLCNGWFKYSRENLALICSGCNMSDDAITLWKLGETLKMRHGEDILLWIDLENKAVHNKGVKQEVWMCVDYASRIAPHRVVI